jgi:hypothetical protein
MDCQMFEEVLFDLTAGTLEPDLSRQCEAHLASCPRCASELAEYRSTVKLIDSLKHRELPESFWQSQRSRVMQAVGKVVSARTWEAPPLYLVALLTVVVGYIFAGLDIGAGILLDLFGGQGRGSHSLPTPLVTLIPLYMGILALALFVFSERGEKAGSRSGQ